MSPRRVVWSDERKAALRKAWADDIAVWKICEDFGITRGQLQGQKMRLNLRPRGGDRAGSARPRTENGRLQSACTEARTIFPKMVRWPPHETVLVSGHDNTKLGSMIEKGPWRGMPIFSLTLEERKTCPHDCVMWKGCYGNAMPFARRTPTGPMLEAALAWELRTLQRRYPRGFAVRLHILGDFHTVDYVRHWSGWLARLPALRIWGYTARLPGTPIGDAVKAMIARHGWERCAIRFSLAIAAPLAAVVSEEPLAGSIACPYEEGKTRSCASCALCWAVPAMDYAIRFAPHGGA